MVINGNGQGQVAGLFLLAHETSINISHMLSIFKKINPDSENIDVIFTDKDFSERNALSEVFPKAKLLLCFFHTLKTFKSKVTCSNMGLSGEERKEAPRILQNIAYASDEIEYEKYYALLLNMKNDELSNYFQTNWHPIRYEWVRGFIKSERTFNITTTNNLESLNAKIKQVVVRNSDLFSFFKDLIACLDSIHSEQKQRAINLVLKQSTSYVEGSGEKFYESRLTPYAWKLVEEELKAACKLQFCFEANAEINCCECTFYKNASLPCRHIFFKRRELEIPITCDTLVPERYSREYHFTSYTVPCVPLHSTSSVISLPAPKKTKILSKQEKYKMAQELCNEIIQSIA